MNKTNPAIFIALFLGLFVAMIGGMFAFIGLDIWFVFIPFFLFIIFFIGMVFFSFKMASGSFEKKMTIYTSCVECHRKIDANSTYCKHCGAEQKHTIICEYCGAENPSDRVQCIECNALLK